LVPRAPEPAKKLRVLLIAEAANPEWVSVPLEGWSHCRAIARLTDAHIVTQLRNRKAFLRAGLREGTDFTAINSEAVAGWANKVKQLLRGGKGRGWTIVTAFSALAYPYFEHLLWKQFGRRIRAGEFDVVHRVTPLSPTVPSFLAARCKAAGVPFVVGPLNGGVPWPAGFDDARLQEREWLSYVRDAYQFLPGYLSTRRNAAAIVIGSRDTWKQMPRSFHNRCVYVPENAFEPALFRKRRTRPATRPLKAIFIGRLVPYKGADMLIEAAAPLVRSGALELLIVGDGPQMPQLRAAVNNGGLQAGVRLAGWVEHALLQDLLCESDVLAFPSIREFGGAVALEAMAVGVVPIVPRYGGLGELVTGDCGYPIEIGTRAQIVQRFHAVLAHLAVHPDEVDAKSIAAARRAHENFSWDHKARHVLSVYHWVLGRAPKPRDMVAS
jgi:glycosyltransferase involved in cell wall biosynthesis